MRSAAMSAVVRAKRTTSSPRCATRADFMPPFEFYAHALGPRGHAAASCSTRLGHEANDAIDEFLSLALAYESANTPSLEGFLHWVERGGAEVKRDMERGRDEVRVMTVHGAKGLEADIVILPDTDARARSHRDNGNLLYTEERLPLSDRRQADAPRRSCAPRRTRRRNGCWRSTAAFSMSR